MRVGDKNKNLWSNKGTTHKEKYTNKPLFYNTDPEEMYGDGGGGQYYAYEGFPQMQ